MKERRIYGIDHSKENAERAIIKIGPEIWPANKVGLECTPNELELYESVARKGLDPEESERLLLKETDFHYCPSSTIFWYKLYSYFKGRGTRIEGLGSERRIGILNTLEKILNNNICSYPDRAEAYLEHIDDDYLKKQIGIFLDGWKKESVPFDFGTWCHYMGSFIDGPHFDAFLAENVMRNSADRIMVGYAHAEKLAKRTGSELIEIDAMDPKTRDFVNSLENCYRNKKHMEGFVKYEIRKLDPNEKEMKRQYRKYLNFVFPDLSQ